GTAFMLYRFPFKSTLLEAISGINITDAPVCNVELRYRAKVLGVIATFPSTPAPYHPFARWSPWRTPWSIECWRVRSSPGPAPRRTPCSINPDRWRQERRFLQIYFLSGMTQKYSFGRHQPCHPCRSDSGPMVPRAYATREDCSATRSHNSRRP